MTRPRQIGITSLEPYRISALLYWTISFFGRSRLERTITAQQVFARRALAASIRGGHHVD